MVAEKAFGNEWTVRVFENEREVFHSSITESVVVGRQGQGDPSPIAIYRQDGRVPRLIVANSTENRISREHVRFDLLPTNELRVTSVRKRIHMDTTGWLEQGESVDLNRVTLLTFDDKVIRVEPLDPEEDLVLQSLKREAAAPGRIHETIDSSHAFFAQSDKGIDAKKLIAWLHATMNVIQSAAHAHDFAVHAATSVREIADLDTAACLDWDGSEWSIRAVASRDQSDRQEGWRPSRTILERVLAEKHTFWGAPRKGGGDGKESTDSLRHIYTLVAAPILTSDGRVAGALYGDRRLIGPGNRSTITEPEAILVELVASGVAAGLARQQHEQAAMAQKVKFEQFFTSELATQLELDPDLLQGRDANVTVLFCDIRGFSAISERIGPAQTMEWIGHVMDALSDCVLQQGGVLVDYIGDELMAMWGAPTVSDDHPVRACRAAIDMLNGLGQIDQRWSNIIESTTRIGIGINSGEAQVGNTGSSRKFKYGPLGNTVNLASRIQGTTKQVKVPLLVTESTARRLSDEFAQRKVCTARVVNIDEPVNLYEVTHAPAESWTDLCSRYEDSLRAFEEHNFQQSVQTLGSVVADFPNDGPSLALLARSVNAMAQGPDDDHPVWTFDSK